MTQRIIYLVLLVFFLNNLMSQTKNIGEIKYNKIINNPNGTVFATPYSLSFDAKASVFKRLGNASEVTNKTKKDYVSEDGTVNSSMIMQDNLPYDYYYTNASKKELIFRETVARKLYTVNDTIENIAWKLHDEHRKIGSYNCQKATAPYRGRQYTVWFTPEIPVSHGPWKLRGLPGLILEAFEETGKYEFRATEASLNVDANKIERDLKIPDNRQKLEKREVYIEALKKKRENMRAIILASLPRGAKVSEDCESCPKKNNSTLEIYN